MCTLATVPWPFFISAALVALLYPFFILIACDADPPGAVRKGPSTARSVHDTACLCSPVQEAKVCVTTFPGSLIENGVISVLKFHYAVKCYKGCQLEPVPNSQSIIVPPPRMVCLQAIFLACSHGGGKVAGEGRCQDPPPNLPVCHGSDQLGH